MRPKERRNTAVRAGQPRQSVPALTAGGSQVEAEIGALAYRFWMSQLSRQIVDSPRCHVLQSRQLTEQIIDQFRGVHRGNGLCDFLDRELSAGARQQGVYRLAPHQLPAGNGRAAHTVTVLEAGVVEVGQRL